MTHYDSEWFWFNCGERVINDAILIKAGSSRIENRLLLHSQVSRYTDQYGNFRICEGCAFQLLEGPLVHLPNNSHASKRSCWLSARQYELPLAAVRRPRHVATAGKRSEMKLKIHQPLTTEFASPW
jgi:hypothetical protein